MVPAFDAVERCWICEGQAFTPVHDARFSLSEYARQDPELAAYSGAHVTLQRCRSCGFAQPAALPALANFFDRMYDQRWSDDWIAGEHAADYKDRIFADILAALEERVTSGRTLLDVGAHAGRFLRLARDAGWNGEGLELNPKTAAFAAGASGAVIHQGNVHTFTPSHCYDVLTLTDVLEHIPRPLDVLTRLRGFLCSGGWIAIKVPNGPAQRMKERLRARLRPSYRATLADNLVHVNHFSARSLARALAATGFTEITVSVAAPELSGASSGGSGHWGRLAAYSLARLLPAGASPLAFNLQAYGRRD
ncbi:MAG TPA: class I SAM-dependent methyltransferase [Vicinamibacterales bacterium]|nr:class I SAM-dependent methyltransferase [Vicinamibacterales bacterium]